MGVSLVPMIDTGDETGGSQMLDSYPDFTRYNTKDENGEEIPGAHDDEFGIVNRWESRMTVFSVYQLVRKVTVDYNYFVRRVECKYDMSSLSGLTVSSARVYFPNELFEIYTNDLNQGDLHVVEGSGTNPLIPASFGYLLDKIISGGKIACPDFPTSGWGNEITMSDNPYIELNAVGISWLTMGSSSSSLAFKIGGDRNNNPNSVLPTELYDYKGEGVFCYQVFTISSARRPIGWLQDVDNIRAITADFHGVHCPGTAMLRIVHDGLDDEYPKYRFVYGLTRDARDNTTSWKSLVDVLPNESLPTESITGLESDTLYYVELEVDYGGNIGTQYCPEYGRNKYRSYRDFRTFTTIAGDVYPSGATTRVSSLVHRWTPGSFTLEMVLGGITSEFGLIIPTGKPAPTIPTLPSCQSDEVLTWSLEHGYFCMKTSDIPPGKY